MQTETERLAAELDLLVGLENHNPSLGIALGMDSELLERLEEGEAACVEVKPQRSQTVHSLH